MAILGEKGEDVSEILAADTARPAVEEVEATEVPTKEVEKEEVVVVKTVSPVAAKPAAASYPSATSLSNGKIKASPLAKQLAKERSINLNLIQGSGEDGRIIKRDIDNYQGGGASFTGTESFVDEPVSQMRKVIAIHIGESIFTAPHVY